MPLAYIRTCMARLQNQRYQRGDNIAAAGRNGLAVEEGFPSLLHLSEACRQPIRVVMKRRRSIEAARMPSASRSSPPRQGPVPPLCWLFRIPLREQRLWRPGRDVRKAATLRSLSSRAPAGCIKRELIRKESKDAGHGACSSPETSSSTQWPGLPLIPSCPAAMRAV